MGRFIFVSNRLPVTVVRRRGRLQFQPSVGGLATGLSSFIDQFEHLWIGWPGIAREKLSDEEVVWVEEELYRRHCVPVFLETKDLDLYYYGYSNKTIWPLFHFFPSYAVYRTSYWERYRLVNEKFAKVVAQILNREDRVWVHDYHLMLLPRYLRHAVHDVALGFFLHIPFPAFEIFRLLPNRTEVLNGMLGADLIGFHTYDYVRYFLDNVRRILGYENTFGLVLGHDRVVRADVFPMGVDFDRFQTAAGQPDVLRVMEQMRERMGNRRVILSVDRLDYTKGIPRRLEAYDYFLTRYPEFREQVILWMVVVPSRMGIEHYQALKRRVDELVGRINGKHGTVTWMPIHYQYRSLPFPLLVAAYRLADVALVTPLRDGMNLIAKEYIATRVDGRGVLVLSDMAGAAKELGEALLVNPNHHEQVAEALYQALTMSEEEQRQRISIMQQRLRRYTITRWAQDFLDRMEDTLRIQKMYLARRFTASTRQALVERYRQARRRLLLLDYDGTLVPFATRPALARPDEELRELLQRLAEPEENLVTILSGRSKDVLEAWLGDLNIGLSAEHGVWVRDLGGQWQMLKALRNDWKDEVRAFLEFYVDRTPGSMIEEKEYSLVWHYRTADPELAQLRARELKDDLIELTKNLGLSILEGDRVIEIKAAGVNKGVAATYFLDAEAWDLVLAAGDDWTDEDVFEVVPDDAVTIKVRLGVSRAKYYVPTHRELRTLLRELVEVEVSR